MEKSELFEAQKGSIIGLINDALLSEGTPELDHDPPQEGEEVIGTLTPLEAAIYLAYQQSADRHNTRARELRESGARRRDNDLRVKREECEALEALFWSAIRVRLGTVDTVGIRNKDQIVRMPKRSRSLGIDPLTLMLAGMAASPFGMGGDEVCGGEGQHEHKCDTCPAFDDCPLPFRRARA